VRVCLAISPALPVGAYSYSEGLETLVDNGVIENKQSPKRIKSRTALWSNLLRGGSDGNEPISSSSVDRGFGYWNNWSAARGNRGITSAKLADGAIPNATTVELQPQLAGSANATGNPVILRSRLVSSRRPLGNRCNSCNPATRIVGSQI